jgi:PGF-CTERM protein
MANSYMKADDGDGHTDEKTVEIKAAVPTPTPPVTPTPTPTPTPVPGFEPVVAIAGLLAIAYLVVFV